LSAVWIVVIVVAVVAVAAFIMTRRRQEGLVGGAESPSAAASPAQAGEAGETEEIPELRAQVVARAEESVAVEAAPAPAVEPGPELEVTAPLPKPALSESELRSLVESHLEESERMLGRLREVSGGETGQPAGAGSVEIMEEGLAEVRALAERKKWSQAKALGEALHAQLSLMLQSAHRESTS
jgi:hypothetical protein